MTALQKRSEKSFVPGPLAPVFFRASRVTAGAVGFLTFGGTDHVSGRFSPLGPRGA